jgi:hypothetical protein
VKPTSSSRRQLSAWALVLGTCLLTPIVITSAQEHRAQLELEVEKGLLGAAERSAMRLETQLGKLHEELGSILSATLLRPGAFGDVPEPLDLEASGAFAALRWYPTSKQIADELGEFGSELAMRLENGERGLWPAELPGSWWLVEALANDPSRGYVLAQLGGTPSWESAAATAPDIAYVIDRDRGRILRDTDRETPAFGRSIPDPSDFIRASASVRLGPGRTPSTLIASRPRSEALASLYDFWTWCGAVLRPAPLQRDRAIPTSSATVRRPRLGPTPHPGRRSPRSPQREPRPRNRQHQRRRSPLTARRARAENRARPNRRTLVGP